MTPRMKNFIALGVAAVLVLNMHLAITAKRDNATCMALPDPCLTVLVPGYLEDNTPVLVEQKICPPQTQV